MLSTRDSLHSSEIFIVKKATKHLLLRILLVALSAFSSLWSSAEELSLITFTVSGSVLFHESRADGDEDGRGEMLVNCVSSCEYACVDAADALVTGGVLVYSAAFRSPLWLSGGNESLHLHLQDREAVKC